MLTRFEKDRNESKKLYALTNWFGAMGMGFESCDTAQLLFDALQTVSDIEDITMSRNGFGLWVVGCEPMTATAAAIAHAIYKAFQTTK